MNTHCPYCRQPFSEQEPGAVRYCSSCGTPHHTECWDENNGCTVFGCASAPADEPKMQVSQSDFGAAAAPAPQPHSGPVPPPPGAMHHPPPPSFGQYAAPAAPYPPPGIYMAPPRSRTAFIVLGIFVGIFGAHNFYAGYKGKAIAQLCLTLCSVFILSIVTGIWALIEVCTIDRDYNNVPMV